MSSDSQSNFYTDAFLPANSLGSNLFLPTAIFQMPPEHRKIIEFILNTAKQEGRVTMISPLLERQIQRNHDLHSDVSGNGFAEQQMEPAIYYLYGNWTTFQSISSLLHSNDLEPLAALMMITSFCPSKSLIRDMWRSFPTTLPYCVGWPHSCAKSRHPAPICKELPGFKL